MKNLKNCPLSVSIYVAIATLILLSDSAIGASSLLITNTRILFDGRQRAAVVDLKNRGDSVGHYRIFFRNKRMLENGNIKDVKTPREGEKPAESLIRYSPRRVVLGPGQGQSVRLMLRKPSDLPPGEYRSHLVFQGMPEAPAPFNEDGSEGGQLDIRFSPIMEYSIPVIVRHGNVWATASLGDFQITGMDRDPSSFKCRLNREGNRSLFGDIEVFLMSGGKTGHRVGFISGLAVYPPLAAREISVPVILPDNLSPPERKLLIRFTENKFGGDLKLEAPFSF